MRMHNESRAVAIVLSSPGQHPARTAAGRLISSERAPHCLFPFKVPRFKFPALTFEYIHRPKLNSIPSSSSNKDSFAFILKEDKKTERVTFSLAPDENGGRAYRRPMHGIQMTHKDREREGPSL